MNNALKFTRDGVSITLNYAIDEEDQCLLFSVTDTGSGIPEDKQELVFQRFEKLNEFVQGTGSVSYTHLDVYKRQVINRISSFIHDFKDDLAAFSPVYRMITVIVNKANLAQFQMCIRDRYMISLPPLDNSQIHQPSFHYYQIL